ncbi:RNA polymerase sigma-70 factor, ECF subfamily [Actinopolymorpha cephalotaxi]|uniref:RNA polymerase sigma-70 factor (ECF subfamily) n=1 Tax=Actinopolymorpha cephalotaxi TaxID=504797 RepID=A0A1I2ZUN8_9ACTN|nr:ECF RNA polymerase sigma factor SigK [Actinopolymorpha cephalotaxi]NYH84181.1 RNA polymerase sigma-70 factor (ECF subfamily) [Actinopolymorpha cephalotaxi]SFH41577.1 RNA polymerase sigma-70 factor, ECF subfamily [Actinopolymorpha cephalotaxi]
MPHAAGRLSAADGAAPASPEDLLVRVGHGDERAFEELYAHLVPQVFGLVVRIVRDPAQAEEVTQEVFVEVWRTATRFDPGRGTATAYVVTMAHRRAVDRVRSVQKSTDRERASAVSEQTPPFDVVADQVEVRLEREQVRRCLGSLTQLQREAVDLAYYGGYTYREVAEVLGANVATVKTRMRDGLIRLRDCLGVQNGAAR